MNAALTANTQAILLLTAPLIGVRSDTPPDLLTPGEYRRLARHLHQLGSEPADLLSSRADDVVKDSSAVVDATRIKRLLGRGFALSQAIERWQTRAIWVISRADSEYPQRLKDRLKEDRPAVLYGCGERSILDSGGLAVVGSRDVDDALVDYTQSIGRLAAKARKTLVSGGARGIDQAAMRGALEAGGKVTGVLADSLEKTALNRDHRSMLMDGQLVLISPYDPSAGFNVGNAMQRNKLIYAFADAALVVNSDLNKGGTWTGAVEQLDKLKMVPVFVRTTGTPSKGLEALIRKGALPWPNPDDSDGLDAVFGIALSVPEPAATQNQLFAASTRVAEISESIDATEISVAPPIVSEPLPSETFAMPISAFPTSPKEDEMAQSPAEELFSVVCRSMSRILAVPKKETEIATELNVTPTQVREWLKRMVESGVVEKGPKKGLYQMPGGLI